jgi:PqqD family protein of HPr-rel-A system
MQWRFDSRGLFYDRDEGMVIYFDPRTGDTHLLSSFAAFLLEHIPADPLDLHAVVEQISPHVDPEDLPESARAIPAILDELAELDIIERV